MLVGVQTNQFPRALDLADRFLPHGIPVVLGGFHVSGTLAMVGMTKDLEAAQGKGVILVAGEVEGGRLTQVISDIVLGQAKPLYNFLNPTPDLSGGIPTPRISREELAGFASPFSTLDTGRGCVFACKFCTIINVQGKTMRFRDPREVIEFVRANYYGTGVVHCFFTDDNLARNPQWRELFARLAQLREEEHVPFTFMMQADLAARKMPGNDFFMLAARAGCNQVFFGVESVNRENLRSQGKFQNQVKEYQALMAHLHEFGINGHAGYIIGLPYDTPQSIRDDLTELRRMGFDSASFYTLTPLPGSEDHQTWLREGRWMEADFNTYDSAGHAAIKPERMSCEELVQAWHDTWTHFYSTHHMVEALKVWRSNPKEYWGRLFFNAWYLYASQIEGLHPMNCGFWTVRHRNDRRSGFPQEAFLPFWFGRARASFAKIRGLVKLYFQLQEVWLQSRPKSQVEESLEGLLARTKQGVVDWRQVKVRELQLLYHKLKDEVPNIKVPSTFTLWCRKHNPFTLASSRTHVTSMWRRWYVYVWNPLIWAKVWLFECCSGIRFLAHLMREGR